MGEAELQPNRNLLIIRAELIFYGDASGEVLAIQVAKNVEDQWNQPGAVIYLNSGWFTKKQYNIRFDIKGVHQPSLTPEEVFANSNPRNNYFRIEEFASGNISFVDGINSNTGYFKLENLLNGSSTAAHEFGHTLGLDHPHNLDIRGKGTPGIMYPRGTLVDPEFQYYPEVAAGEKGGTLNPFTRKVLQNDIYDLQLNKLDFDNNSRAVVGGFTSIWHEKHLPPNS
jgi:hypothetical protein